MESMVPLDRALMSSYRVSIVPMPLSVTVWPQFANFDWGSDSKYPLPTGERGPCLIQCHLGPHECPCQMASRSIQWI